MPPPITTKDEMNDLHSEQQPKARKPAYAYNCTNHFYATKTFLFIVQHVKVIYVLHIADVSTTSHGEVHNLIL